MLLTYQFCYKFGFLTVLAVCYWRKLMAQIFKCEQQQQQQQKGTKRSEFVLRISSICRQPWMFANILILDELGICVIEMYPACCWPYFSLLFRGLWLHACTSYILDLKTHKSGLVALFWKMEILLNSELTHSFDEELFIAFIPALDA